MDNDIMIDVVKKVFSTYQPGDMGLDLRDVITTQENVIKMLEANKWHYDNPLKSGSYIVHRNTNYLYPYCVDFYSISHGWDSSDGEDDVIAWKPIYFGVNDELIADYN